MEKDLQQTFDVIQQAVTAKKISGLMGMPLVETLNKISKSNALPLKFKLVTIEDRVSEMINIVNPDQISLDDESSSEF